MGRVLGLNEPGGEGRGEGEEERKRKCRAGFTVFLLFLTLFPDIISYCNNHLHSNVVFNQVCAHYVDQTYLL